MLDLIFLNIDFLIDLILAFITMSLGLNLTRDDFGRIFTNPRPLGIGLLSQMVLLPLCTLGLMLLSDFPPAIKVGFIIISLCPGGVTSNLVSYLLKGNVALSISLTVINGILCMFTIPLLANMALDFFFHHRTPIQLPVLHSIMQIALVTILPATVGVMIRSKLPRIADKLRPVLKYLLPALLLFVFLIKIFAPVDKGGTGLTIDEILTLSVWVLMLNFCGMLVGFLAGSLLNINLQNKVTIMVEVGLHNTFLAIFVASNILNNTEMQKPALVSAMFTFFSTLIFAWLIRFIAVKYFTRKAEA